MNSLAVVVLAAGKGTRMESDLPKVLHRLQNRPLVGWVLDGVRELRPARTVVVVGHKAELVENQIGPDYAEAEFVNQGEMLGTGHAVLQTKDKLIDFEGEILVTCGDAPLLTGATLSALVEKRRATNAAASMLVGRLDHPGSYGRVVMQEGGAVEKIVEAKDASSTELALPTVNAGTYCFRSRDLWEQLQKVGNSNKAGEYYLTDVIGLLRENGESVVGVHVSEREMTGVNTKAELAELETQLNEEARALAQSEAMPS